jgi:hypothetical protein
MKYPSPFFFCAVSGTVVQLMCQSQVKTALACRQDKLHRRSANVGAAWAAVVHAPIFWLGAHNAIIWVTTQRTPRVIC